MERRVKGGLCATHIQPAQSEQVYCYNATLHDQKGELKIMP